MIKLRNLSVMAAALSLCWCSAAPSYANENPVSDEMMWNQDMIAPEGSHAILDLGPVSEKFCFLTGVSGKFEGSGEIVNLSPGNGTDWFLTGGSLQTGGNVAARARCVPWAAFKFFPSVPEVHVLWPKQFEVHTTWSQECTSSRSPSCTWYSGDTGGDIADCSTGNSGQCRDSLWAHNTILADAKSFCILSTISGPFHGAGEFARIMPQESSDRRMALFVASQVDSQPNPVQAMALCSTLGQNENIAYLGGVDVSGEYTWTQGSLPVVMASTSEGFCFLTGMSGKFRGAGEAIEIVPQSDHWVLQGRSSQEGVQANARCVAYLQQQKPLKRVYPLSLMPPSSVSASRYQIGGRTVVSWAFFLTIADRFEIDHSVGESISDPLATAWSTIGKTSSDSHVYITTLTAPPSSKHHIFRVCAALASDRKCSPPVLEQLLLQPPVRVGSSIVRNPVSTRANVSTSYPHIASFLASANAYRATRNDRKSDLKIQYSPDNGKTWVDYSGPLTNRNESGKRSRSISEESIPRGATLWRWTVETK